MPGRQQITDAEAMRRGYHGEQNARRRAVLAETLDAFDRSIPRDRYHRMAQRNLERWAAQPRESEPTFRIRVLPHDWGVATARLTRAYGRCFAVLNMANAYYPGGGYVEGAVAQEENMFRRTDCHYSIDESQYDPATDRYRADHTRLLSAADGRVYMDTTQPRVCIRGPEDRSRADLGYRWLSDDKVFPFFEMRAAAQDLRDGRPFDPCETRRRIVAQLDSLSERGIRHVVLGAFGCGAFGNPAAEVAAIYKSELFERRRAFTMVAFAVFHAGYGPGNYGVFRDVFERP